MIPPEPTWSKMTLITCHFNEVVATWLVTLCHLTLKSSSDFFHSAVTRLTLQALLLQSRGESTYIFDGLRCSASFALSEEQNIYFRHAIEVRGNLDATIE